MDRGMGVKAFGMKLDAELEIAQAWMEQLEARAHTSLEQFAPKLKVDATRIGRP